MHVFVHGATCRISIFYVFVPEDCFYWALAEALMKYLHYAIFHLGFHCLPK